jgi:N-ATPase, AtpR subunit
VISHRLAATLWSTAVFAAAGLAFGCAYFAALRRAVALRCADAGAPRTIVLSLGRLAAAAGFFLLAARSGGLPLLAALMAFLLARTLAVRAVRMSA